jgi:adenylate cyclase
MIYALLGDETARSDAFEQLAAGQAEFLAAYRRGDWGEAARLLDRLSPRYATIAVSGLEALYRERLAALAANPPGAEWDGVYRATRK